MGELFNTDNIGVAIITIGALSAFSFIFIFVLWIQLIRMRRKYKKLVNGLAEGNFEEILMQIKGKLEDVQNNHKNLLETLNSAFEKMKKMKSRVGIHRYSAFSGEGNDLSFTIAMLDDDQDGVLLTGIHSREQTFLYAKPIEKGNSKYALSPEEKETINRTLRQS
jgi:L-rhamnose mutarotase